MERGSKIALVEYLRGLAALSVAWFHLTNQYPPGPVQVSGAFGWLGVGVFFVISGFVLPLSIWQRNGKQYGIREARSFAWRRIARIEPPYLISAVLAVAMWQLSSMLPGFRGTPPHVSWGALAAHVAYLPELFGYGWLQPVYWTLAYEFIFYTALGLCYAWFVQRPLMWVVILVAGGEAMSYLARGHMDGLVPLFAAGVFVFLGAARLVGPRIAFSGVGAMSLASVWVDPFYGTAGFATALLLMFGQGVQLPRRLHGPAMFLGLVSYSLYVTHVVIGGRIINLGSRFVETESGRLALSVAALAAVIGFAWCFWYVVERHFVKLAARRPRPAAA